MIVMDNLNVKVDFGNTLLRHVMTKYGLVTIIIMMGSLGFSAACAALSLQVVDQLGFK